MKSDDRAATNAETVVWEKATAMEDRQRVLRRKMRVYPPALAAQLKALQQARPALARAAGANSSS